MPLAGGGVVAVASAAMVAGRGARGRGRRGGPGRAPAGYLIGELAAIVGVTPRAIRFYVERGLLKAPVFGGNRTRYGEEHLLRIRAIQRLQAEEGLRLDAIRQRLAKLSPAELTALAPPEPAAGPPEPGAGGGAQAAPAGPLVAAGAADRWDRIALLPGLELHVRSDATPLVLRLAAEIQAKYGTSARGRGDAA
jgi:DNA-binding transcriptional MerR regulator